MRKTLQDAAGYLKKIMVSETHEAYALRISVWAFGRAKGLGASCFFFSAGS